MSMRWVKQRWQETPIIMLVSCILCVTTSAVAQQANNGEWRYWGSDAASSRYLPLTQIDANNFEDLEVAWVWKGDNFGPSADNILRATPIYVNGRLYSVAGQRRTVVSIDPATGETLWTFREPPTERWENSMRKNYGKGVAYAEVDGKGRIYVVTPAFFLHALDPDTGYPIETFGSNGTVDLLADFGYDYDPDAGIPREVGYITNSSPPIVVNDVPYVSGDQAAVIRGSLAEESWCKKASVSDSSCPRDPRIDEPVGIRKARIDVDCHDLTHTPFRAG